jgi:hypothetical protein
MTNVLPIRRVVLFKHGVGYFEREGNVEGDTSIDLAFKAAEMNDVLKSLTVLDLGEGHIASISYESTLPTEKRLEDVAIRLPEGNSLSGLLEQVKGARVAVVAGSDRVEGVVAGIETRWRKAGDDSLHEHQLVLLVGGSSLRTFELTEVKSLDFLDEGLRKDLQHLLEILIGAKKKDLKRLTIFARGDGSRPVQASYVVETPVWKTSYRVMLGQSETRIQGWALVDNTQDEDWDDVALTLVAGLPISFVHDLYAPRHRRRPVVEVREEEAYAPPILEQAAYETAGAGDEMRSLSRGAAPGMHRPPPPPPMPGMARAAPAPAAMGPPSPAQRSQARERSVQVQTRTVEVGDLFQYVLDRPVTVKRNQSALVPILAAALSGKRVAIYNPDVRDKNPLSAIWLENTTGLTLEGGPLTVLENEDYVGESMLETMKPGEKRLVPYSVELGCVVAVDHESDVRDVNTVRIVNGVLHLLRYKIARTIYRVTNKTAAVMDLFLEHRFEPQWKLVDTPKPLETTESFQRFRFDASAKGETRFVVTEQGDQWESVYLTHTTRDQLKVWVASRYLSPAAHEALGEIVSLNERVAESTRRQGELQVQINEIGEKQARVRENLSSLRESRDEQRLRERYVADLTRDEDALVRLSAELEQARREKQTLDAELRQRTSTLKFDATL